MAPHPIHCASSQARAKRAVLLLIFFKAAPYAAEHCHLRTKEVTVPSFPEGYMAHQYHQSNHWRSGHHLTTWKSTSPISCPFLSRLGSVLCRTHSAMAPPKPDLGTKHQKGAGGAARPTLVAARHSGHRGCSRGPSELRAEQTPAECSKNLGRNIRVTWATRATPSNMCNCKP